MKNLLILILIGYAFNVSAQNMTFSETSKSTTIITEDVNLGEKVFTLTLTKKGSYKLARPDYQSKWQYLGYKTTETFTKGNITYPVFKNTKDEYFYYVVNDKGNPSKRSLIINF